ncbi:unnamed protein product [Lathyrus oleraceus]
MIMQNPALDPKDQRVTSSMEDSNAMTIEFLRARLLSERSISRSARQRLDELEKKVVELEEQLRTVTLQRKMAEKATADVLAILEDQGISDASVESDSSSDIDIPCESGISNDSSKEGERYTGSKGRQHGSDEMYGSCMNSSPVFIRSLSWKGRHDSPRSLEKYKNSNMRRQNSFSSANSSPKHHHGKSCRKIRHRLNRSAMEESNDKSVNDDCNENAFVSSSEGYPKISIAGSNIPRIESKIPEEDESEVNQVNKNHHEDEYGREENMEKALEHQAQLIDQFEAMEKTQREWEDKFREKNSTTPDSYDPGNHSDMTEDKEESKDQIPYSSKVVTPNAQEYKSEPGGVKSSEVFKFEARDVMPKSHDDTRGYNNQNNSTLRTSSLVGQEKSHSPLSGNRNESSKNHNHQSSETNNHDPRGHGHPGSKPSFPNVIQGGLHQKDDASRNKNDLYALVFHKQSHEFNGVLESLKQARTSLQHELNRLPLVESSKAIKPSTFVGKSEGRFEIPVGFSGLFRLPTDFSDEASSRFGVHDSTAGFGSNLYHYNRGMSRTSDGQFITNPYHGAARSLSAVDQSHATRYLENGPISDSKKSHFDPFSNGGGPPYSSQPMYHPSFPINPSYHITSSNGGGPPNSSQPMYPSFPINPSYHITSSNGGGPPNSSQPMYPSFPINPSYHITSPKSPQMPFGGELSKPYSSRTVGFPHDDPFSFHGDHLR